MSKMSLLSPIFGIQKRLQAVEADTPFGSLFKILLPGPLAYTPALLMPASCFLAAWGAVYGPYWVDQLLTFVTSFDGGTMAAIIGQHWPATGLVHLAVLIAFASMGALCDFIAVPVLDVVLGRDLSAADHEHAKAVETDPAYRSVLHSFAAVHLASLVSSCYVAGTFDLHPLAFTGLILSQAAAGGVMLTVVHELVHSRHKADHLLASTLLCTVNYMWWSLGHMAHHLNVGKYDDPATARRGETLYEFIPRSIIGHLRDGAAMERQRLNAKGIAPWSPRSRLVWWAVCPLTMAAACFTASGPGGLIMLMGQAAGSVLLLEVVNYLEHFGLERQQLDNGRWEKVQAKHSWNANWIATSAITFRLQRHADHHLTSSRPYQALQDIDEAPQLPASYPAMAILALFPGLFFDVMNPRLDDYLALTAKSDGGSSDAAVPRE